MDFVAGDDIPFALLPVLSCAHFGGIVRVYLLFVFCDHERDRSGDADWLQCMGDHQLKKLNKF